MGVRGAAIATVIARIVETAIALLYVLRYDQKLCLRARELFRGDASLRRDFIRYGVPVVMGDVVWSVNLMASTKILGGFGASVLTAANTANTMNTLAYVAINGLASAVGIITGKTIGAGRTDLMKEYARTTQVIFLALGIVLGGLIFAFAGAFVSMYTGHQRRGRRGIAALCARAGVHADGHLLSDALPVRAGQIRRRYQLRL